MTILDDLEKIWSLEMEENYLDPIEISKELTVAVCKHCGSFIQIGLTMQHLKSLHPDPYVIVEKKWDELQKAKSEFTS